MEALYIIVGGIGLVVVGFGVFILTKASSKLRDGYLPPAEAPLNRLLDGNGTQIQLPEVLDQRRIINQLQQLQDAPSIFEIYVIRLWKKFASHNDRALLLDWVKTFEVGKQVIDAHAEMQRSQNEFNRLHIEDTVKCKEADVKLANFDADIEEANLRKAMAAVQRKRIKQSDTTPEPQAPEATTDGLLGDKQKELEQLQARKRAEERKINNNGSLSEQERKERLGVLESTYQQEKLKVQVGFGGFEED
jgi:hypothetical protein